MSLTHLLLLLLSFGACCCRLLLLLLRAAVAAAVPIQKQAANQGEQCRTGQELTASAQQLGLVVVSFGWVKVAAGLGRLLSRKGSSCNQWVHSSQGLEGLHG